ncbi:WhiB family transcriptional regulator [Streptomyces sp. NBC_00257]|uniref:WhiB family transcriptional regulator n=1 Tax=unclassified Streptomyces TaxID=2593676 RepID=UPI00225C2F7B|nr:MULTISPECIES: WhiB family transcriptional regulator [unclassified Streptomyces]MCX5431909.1 WhiB family transcriptional regulator [Streptomyces sp. NBC_00062]
MKYEWMDQALCAQVDSSLWYPEGPRNTSRAALRVCAACPVRAQCADHAAALEGNLSAKYRYGAWGGKSVQQRALEGGAPQVGDRDEQIIRMTDRGMTPAAIAKQLGISDRTVARVRKAHRQQQEAAA